MAEFNTFKFTSLLSSLVALICLALAMSKPIAHIMDFYDVHLFPEDDQINYRVSDLHRHSQNLHIATTFFLCVAIITHFMENTRMARGMAVRWIQMASSVLSMTLYIAAVATLMSVAKHIKDNIDNLPIPLPDIKIERGGGATADVIGVLASVLAGVMSVMSATSRDAGYEPI